MSVEVTKILLFYEQSMAMLNAKNELLLNDKVLSLFYRKDKESELESWTGVIGKSLAQILKWWRKKFSIFSDFRSDNSACINQIEIRLKSLRDSSDSLSKEDQLISEIKKSIFEWNQATEAVQFYDIKKREALKTEILSKIKQIKELSEITRKSAAPMYLKKLQQELKNTIYAVYQNQSDMDYKIKQKATLQWEKVSEHFYEEDRNIRKSRPFNYLEQEKFKFFQNFSELLLNKKSKLKESQFINYYKQLSLLIKNTVKFWGSYYEQLNDILSLIDEFLRQMDEIKQDFGRRQEKVIKLLEKTNVAVGRIYNIETCFKIITYFSELFEICKVLKKFIIKIKQIAQIANENLKYSQDYYSVVLNQFKQRQKQFYFYSIDDKKFIQTSLKSESSISKKLIQIFSSLLVSLHQQSSQISSIFQKSNIHSYQRHQIGSIVNKQISAILSQETSNTLSKSQYSSTSGFTKTKQQNLNAKNGNLLQIQKFSQSILLYDPNGINWKRNNIFSCALGPKLLLHGKMAILQQGIYFESIFNKKNLIFGRTRLFIPSSDILQLETQNTLVVFPDAIQVTTKRGQLYFHSLGLRQIIFNTLNQVYFPENKQVGDEECSQIQFISDPQKSQETKYTQIEIKQLVKPYEIDVISKVFNGIKLNKFFRRYMGDDKFSIRGQQYENFKSYFLLQIEALQPKCTKLTPQPPSYFLYKNEKLEQKNYPSLSERIHTYKKGVPRIPFLSSGGHGFCQDKQEYYWVSSKILVVLIVSKVKGFSLIESMELHTKMVMTEQQNSVRINLSTVVKFTNDASTNNLIKGPAISNLKQSMIKMVEIIQKYERGKRGRRKEKQEKGQDNQVLLQEKVGQLEQENKILKKNMRILICFFLVLYIGTIILLKI